MLICASPFKKRSGYTWEQIVAAMTGQVKMKTKILNSYKTSVYMTYMALFIGVFFAATDVYAGSREQAKRIHERLTGVTPDETTLLAMADLIDMGEVLEAADIAMDHPDFYQATIKTWATPWTNREFDVFEPLNDYTATVMGLIRDEADFRDLFTADVVYVGADSLGLSPYSNTGNDHYEELELGNYDLSDDGVLQAQPQSFYSGLPSAATAGVLTSRAAAKSFFVLGTNRAMFRYTLVNHLCTDMEQLQDVSLPPDRIRQDVSRSPGGDSRVFNNNCIGCHSGMDPLAQGFGYYDYVFDADADPDAEFGQISYNNVGTVDPDTGSRVVSKYHNNSATFPYGFVTPDDSWSNYWRTGQNRSLGWSTGLPGQGEGAKSLGEELANSDAFAQCQASKTFELVCLREPGDAADRAEVASLASTLQSGGYNMKDVFAGAADYCKGI